MKPTLFLTRKIPLPAIKKLKETFLLNINMDNRVLTKDELRRGIKKCDVLLCLLTDDIDDELISCNPDLKGIANYAVGYNNIDISEATKRKIPVTNTPGVLTDTTADLAWSLLMAVARKIVPADEFTREQKFTGWDPMLFLGKDIHHKTIGIVGGGRIGTAMAKRAQGFSMNVLYFDIQRRKSIENMGATFAELKTILSLSDFISLHLPFVPETRHLIGKEEFSLMKTSAIVINTSRGPIIDEQALVEALQANQIAGAGLDVYEFEPKVHEALRKLNSTILLPHIGSASVETRTEMGLMAAKNAKQMIEGSIPDNIINAEIYAE